MSIRTRRRVARAVAIAAIAACAAGGCTTALRSDPGDDPALAPPSGRGPTGRLEQHATPADRRPRTAGTALADLDDVEPVLLGAPEFGREPPAVSGSGGLSVVAQNQNEIVDTAGWFRSHKLVEPSLDPDRGAAGRAAELPRHAAGHRADRAGDGVPALRRGVRADRAGRGTAGTRQVAYALDLGQYARAPRSPRTSRTTSPRPSAGRSRSGTSCTCPPGTARTRRRQVG